MTRDNVIDLINQCHDDGHVFLIAVAEARGDGGSMLTMWDNIDTVDMEGAEREFIDDVIETFKEQKRW
jgi:hypothetical protein